MTLAHVLYHARRHSPQLKERFTGAKSVLLFLKNQLEALGIEDSGAFLNQ
jgi:hypothetical protein